MASLVKQYAVADAAERVRLISSNFVTFLGIIDSHIDGLVYLIEREKASNRRGGIEDLGVRVQDNKISDITGNTATNNVLIRDALMGCDFSNGVLTGTDREEEFKKDAFVIRQMRLDYKLYNAQLNSLKPRERDIFMSRIESHAPLGDIADANGISVESARKCIFRIKQKLMKQVVTYMEGSI